MSKINKIPTITTIAVFLLSTPFIFASSAGEIETSYDLSNLFLPWQQNATFTMSLGIHMHSQGAGQSSASEFKWVGDNSKEEPVSFMSFNIRFDKPSNPVPSMINEWENRKEHIVSLINFYTPDFLGLQEDQVHQVEYFENELEEYDWIASGGKNDGKESGEFCSIHYNTNRFELVQGTANTIWLSETPDRPSTSWDGASPRILNYGKFKDKKSGKEFYVFNTHFDHAGQTAREESTKLILQKTEEISDDIPYIIMGDFNATEGNPVYKILTRGKPLQDAFYASENSHVGPLFTREGWKVMSDSRKRRIDYIFASEGVCVINHAILTTFRKGNYLSDHLPVYVDIAFEQ